MTLDLIQLQQCEMQGELFESLNERDIDAKVFIRAFMNSRAAKGLDATFDHMQWAGAEYIFEDVVEEFSLKQDKNPPRYNPEALYYAGYITRYWHYLTGESTKAIYDQCDENLLLEIYGFHSEANELAIEDIKAIKARSEDVNKGENNRQDLKEARK